jgi:general bacterial porin, GBP family
MNKKLVALAVAGALGAPIIASAQAGSVVLYGTVRGGLTSTKFSGGGRAFEEASYSSRFGIRASEGIGGGLTGFAHLEVGYDASLLGTNASYGTRESWVGLSGGFGEVKFGAGLNVYDDVMGMMHNSLVAGYNNINAAYFGGTGVNGAGAFANYNGGPGIACVGTANDGRYGNSVRYASPKLGPIQYRGQYSIGNEGATGRKCSAFDNALLGGFGPVQFGLGYIIRNNFQAGAGVLEHDATNIIGVVKGSFGVVDANLGVEQTKYEANWNNSSGKATAFVAGLGVNFGPTKVGLDYTSRDKGITATGAGLHNARVTEVGNGGGKLTTLYVNHAFSKRTLGYVWVSQNKPESSAKSTQIAFNLRHNY